MAAISEKPGLSMTSATATRSPAALSSLNCRKPAGLRRNNADGGQPVDHILHRQPGQDDGGDAREDHGDPLVQPAFGDDGQAQDDAGRHHHRQQRGISCQRAGQRPGEAGIDDNHRHDGGWSGQQRNGKRIDGEVVAVRFIGARLAGVTAARALGAFALLAFRRQHVQRDRNRTMPPAILKAASEMLR